MTGLPLRAPASSAWPARAISCGGKSIWKGTSGLRPLKNHCPSNISFALVKLFQSILRVKWPGQFFLDNEHQKASLFYLTSLDILLIGNSSGEYQLGRVATRGSVDGISTYISSNIYQMQVIVPRYHLQFLVTVCLNCEVPLPPMTLSTRPCSPVGQAATRSISDKVDLEATMKGCS